MVFRDLTNFKAQDGCQRIFTAHEKSLSLRVV